MLPCKLEPVQSIHIIIIVTWSGVLYHVEWMRAYHWITPDAKRLRWSDGMSSSTRRDTVRQIKYLFLTFWFLKIVLVFIPAKLRECLPLRFVTSYYVTLHHHVFRLWLHAWNLLYVTSLQKQVTGVSKPQFVDPALCIRWPANRQFKHRIIYRYIIKFHTNVKYRIDNAIW